MGECPGRGCGTREKVLGGDSQQSRKCVPVDECSSRLELIRGFTVRRSISPGRGPQASSPAYCSRTPTPPMPEPHPHLHQQAEVRAPDSPTSTEESHPLPNPNVSVEDEGQGGLDERSLNVLAAREISKQMELSGSPLSPPSLPFAGRKSVSPRPSFTTDNLPSNNNDRFGQMVPPPLSPSPQFTNSMENRDVTPIPDRQQSPQLPPPPIGAMPRSTSMDSDGPQSEDPYHTPPEYLRNLSTPPSPPMHPGPPLEIQIPKISPLLPSPSTPTTMNKISVAAFRRPGMKGQSNSTNVRGDTLRQDSLGVGFRPSLERGKNENVGGILENVVTPLNLRKKSLPSVPGPPASLLSGPREQGVPRSVSSPYPNLRTSEEGQGGVGRMAALRSSPEPEPRESMIGGEDEFDYLSAYLDGDERRESRTHNRGTNGYEHYGGGPGTDPR